MKSRSNARSRSVSESETEPTLRVRTKPKFYSLEEEPSVIIEPEKFNYSIVRTLHRQHKILIRKEEKEFESLESEEDVEKPKKRKIAKSALLDLPVDCFVKQTKTYATFSGKNVTRPPSPDTAPASVRASPELHVFLL